MFVRSILLINASWNICTNCLCNSKSIKSPELLFSNSGEKKVSPHFLQVLSKTAGGELGQGHAWHIHSRPLDLSCGKHHLICSWPHSSALERVLCATCFSINSTKWSCLSNLQLVSLVSSCWNYMINTSLSARALPGASKNCSGSQLNCEASGYQRAGFPWEHPGNRSLSFCIRC